MFIDKEIGIRALYGGLLLGGGGGGSFSGGMEILNTLSELNQITLHNIDNINENSIIVTASLVGSPASNNKFVGIYHYMKVYENLIKLYDKKISGIITNEIGAQTITNGWILSAMTGIPIIDAPCNGRAHPTGAMGSMGLSCIKEYNSLQVCAGGKGQNEIELSVSSTIERSSGAVRNASILAGGFVTVLRNPVTAKYVKNNAAIGGLSYAIKLGDIIYKNIGNLYNIINGLIDASNMDVICTGRICDLSLITRDGFDVGDFNIDSGKKKYNITFWNEYMTAESDNERLATFPELIAIFDQETALPITSAEIKNNMKVILTKLPIDKIILGKGMSDLALFKQAEKVINKDLIKYSFEARSEDGKN